MGNMIAQTMVVVLSGLTVWLLAQKGRWQKWGYVTGLASEPFWVWSIFGHGQWGILLLVAWHTYSYIIGLRNHWGQK